MVASPAAIARMMNTMARGGTVPTQSSSSSSYGRDVHIFRTSTAEVIPSTSKLQSFAPSCGVMQAPGLPDEDRSGGFEHGGWQMPLMDDEAGSAITEGLAATGGLLLGRVTYEIFAGFWPNAPADDPLAQTINGLPKYVVSTTLREPLEWNNSHLIKGDVANEVARLKAEPGKDLRVIGSGELVQTLIGHDQ